MKKQVINVFASLCLLTPCFAVAQNNGHETTDTVVVEEGVKEDQGITPPPPQETGYESTSQSVFLHKWLFSSDTQYRQRNLPVQFLKQLKGDKEFWYADSTFMNSADTALKNFQVNNLPNKSDTLKQTEISTQTSKDPGKEISGGGGFFTILLWFLVVGAFVGVILWYLTSKDVKIFRRKDRQMPGKQEEELSEQDIFAINYQRDVEKAEQAGNYRLAIRLRFLRLLKQLAERNIIQYKQDKTNFDYLLQLQPTAYYNSFFRITRSYEYSWYGKFDVPEAAYASVRQEFTQLEKQLI